MPVVLGGGLAGLSASYYLALKGIKRIKLFEKSNRLGGWVRTENHTDKGFMFEFGPHTIRPKGIGAPSTLELIEELGLEKEILPIYSSSDAAKTRMIYAKNNLHKLPSSLSDVFRKLPPFSKPLISGLLHDIKSPSSKQKSNDESIYNFIERRFGTEIAKYAISAMICGICAGDAKEISVRFLMNDLFEKEQKFGGICKGIIGSFFEKENQQTDIKRIANLSKNSKLFQKAKDEKWSIYSFKTGTEVLARRLQEELQSKGVEIINNSDCNQLFFTNNKVVYKSKGKEEETDSIISSLPTYSLANIVEDQHPSLASQLRSISYVDVAVVNLKYSNDQLIKNKAFGFLVPPIENLPILGIIYDSCCVPMSGTVLTVMMGGKWFEKYLGPNPTQKEVSDIALNYIEKILFIKDQPDLTRVNILRKCIPQYTVGHRERVDNIRNYIKKYKLPLYLCGAAYDGVGVNDVILSAKTQVYTSY